MIVSCESCRDLIWDHFYELLEVDQVAALRAHLADCADCQEALRRARSQQERIARAARLQIEVAPFVLPDEAPSVLPLPQRRRSRLAGSLIAAAAVLIVTVGLPYQLYEGGREKREREFALTFQSLSSVLNERGLLKKQAAREQETLVQRERGKHLRVQVLGPAALAPGSNGPHQVRVTDLNGAPKDADVTARILAADDRELHQISQRTRDGVLVVTLPADLPNDLTGLRLDVTAVGADAQAHLRERLRARQPELLTHLAVSKLLYQPGDVVFFRSVTLDRFTHEPVPPGMRVHYALADPAGQVVYRARADLVQGGIGGGAVELPRQGLREGAYTLTVTDADGRFPAQAQRLHVLRPVRLKKELEFDKNSYQPGEVVRAIVRAHRLQSGQAVAEQLVTGTLKIDGEPVGKAIRTRTDSQGAAKIEVALPRKAGRSYRLTVVINDPGNAEALERDIPLTAPALAIEFFPEGGQLVAGVLNRVYFRARTARGEAADVRGVLVDGQGRQTAAVATAAAPPGGPGLPRGLGVFTFVPERGESYALHADGAESPIPLPAVHESGVVLSTSAGVVNAGEPITAVVHVADTKKDLIIAAFCRGRLVAYETVAALTGSAIIRMSPPADVTGVIRLTVFDEQGELRPVAERLVFRVPTTALRLGLESKVEKSGTAEKARLSIRVRQEDGAPAPAWLLATVVDQESAGLAGTTPAAGLPAHFQLLSELRRPEDLEDADLLLSDHPAARTALDLYLGTQGWRRFTDSAVAKGEGHERAAQRAGAALVKLDSYSEAWRECEQSLAPELAALRNRLTTQDRELVAEQEQGATAATEANARLGDFQQAAHTALWLAVAALFLTGCVLGILVVLAGPSGTGRAWTVSARRYLAGVSAALMVGGVVVAVVLQPRLGQTVGSPLSFATLARKPLDFSLPQSLLVAVPARQEGILPEFREAGVPPQTLTASRLDALTERRSLANGAAGRQIRGITPGIEWAVTAAVSPERPQPDKAVVPDKPEEKAVARQYAYLPDPAVKPTEDLPDTVLWHPVLFAEDGTAQLDVALPRRGASYQVLLLGHTATGRLGFLRSELKTTAP